MLAIFLFFWIEHAAQEKCAHKHTQKVQYNLWQRFNTLFKVIFPLKNQKESSTLQCKIANVIMVFFGAAAKRLGKNKPNQK